MALIVIDQGNCLLSHILSELEFCLNGCNNLSWCENGTKKNSWSQLGIKPMTSLQIIT